MSEQPPTGDFSGDFSGAVAGVAALAEPLRRRPYDVVAGADDAVSREQAAQQAAVPAHTAKFHLDKLVEQGLLDVEYRRLTGRTGPGSGRPAKLYRRADRELSVSLPARQYDLLSRILATTVATATTTGSPWPTSPPPWRVPRVRGSGPATPSRARTDLARLADALAAGGYEPRLAEGTLELRNCRFHRVAQEQTALVCASTSSTSPACATASGATASRRLSTRARTGAVSERLKPGGARGRHQRGDRGGLTWILEP